MDERVFFAAAPSYSQSAVDDAVEGLFRQLPAAVLLAPGKKVLLKPNLLSGTAPEKAVTTHPAVVAAVIRAAKRRGVAPADITVADSPGGPHASGLVKAAWKASGIAAVCAEEGVQLYTGTASGEAPKAEGAKRRFTLLEPVLAADIIIDLPKCKTHMMTGLSAATKNLFGCIPGLQKAEWHMRCPKKEDFGDMLIDLLLTVKPSFAVLDGVVAHEGNGPSGGSPRPLGFLAAAEDMLSMDLALCRMLGLAPESVPYLAAAGRRGLCPAAFDPALAAGETALFAPVENFRLPDSWRKMNFSDSAPPGGALGGARGGKMGRAPAPDRPGALHRLRPLRRDLPPAHHRAEKQKGSHQAQRLHPLLLLPRGLPGAGHRHKAVFPL